MSRRDKHRYLKCSHDGASFIDVPERVEEYLDECDDPSVYTLESVWMTNDEFKRLPEFTGF